MGPTESPCELGQHEPYLARVTCIYAGLQQEAALQHPACPRGRVLHVR